MRVLYVDDESSIREIARLALGLKPNFEVRTASGGAEALAILDEGWEPDVVLLDVMMPQMDGPATLAAMRARRGGDLAPVAFITARVMPAERERLMQLGAAAVIAKPFNPLSLASQVESLAASNLHADFAETYQAMRAQFRARCADDSRELLSFVRSGSLHGEEALGLLHKLAGSAGTFGFAAVSARARELEVAVKTRAVSPSQISALFEALRDPETAESGEDFTAALGAARG